MCEVCIERYKIDKCIDFDECINCIITGGKSWNFEPIQPTVRKLTIDEVDLWVEEIEFIGSYDHKKFFDRGIELGYIEPAPKTALEEARSKFLLLYKKRGRADEGLETVKNLYEKAIEEIKGGLK